MRMVNYMKTKKRSSAVPYPIDGNLDFMGLPEGNLYQLVIDKLQSVDDQEGPNSNFR